MVEESMPTSHPHCMTVTDVVRLGTRAIGLATILLWRSQFFDVITHANPGSSI
jgi:hypothetical protein